MKKILMTAVAVSALSAGAASAATLSPSSTVGAVSLSNGAATPAIEPLTIANETDAPGSWPAVLKFAPSSATAIGAGSYKVTWNVVGATFSTTVAPTFGGTGGSCSISTSGLNQIVALCTVATTLTDVDLNATLVLTSKSPVSVSGSITTTDGTAVDGGTIVGGTIIDFRNGMKLTGTPRARTLVLADGFKSSYGTDGTNVSTATTPQAGGIIATGVGLVQNSAVATVGADLVFDKYVSGAANKFSPNAVVTAITATLNGTLGSVKPVFGSAVGAYSAGSVSSGVFTRGTTAITNAQSPVTAGSAVASLSAANITAFTSVPADVVTGVTTAATAQTGVVALAQASATTTAAIAESGYTLTVVPTMATGYTAQSYANRTLGSVAYQGTAFYAPWFGDGSNGISYSVRLSNAGTTAIPYVNVTIGSPFVAGTSGTVASTAACSVGSIPAAGELLISSATLSACFGAFKRADVTITVGSEAAPVATTAKMRSTSVNGTVSEVSLGTGANTTVNA